MTEDKVITDADVIDEIEKALPLATISQNGLMRDFHSRKVEGIEYSSKEKNRFVYRTGLNIEFDLYANFQINIFHSNGSIESADCFLVCVNNASEISFKNIGAFTSTIKSFIKDDILYFYFELYSGYGKIVIYPDYNLRTFELTDMTAIPSDATHITSME